ncbi:OmpH family outer membrane protein [Candidatus Dependentiae bacterium]|nr:OmpH family outer membrane protein [Candidatus Dependentiae bacterium]
MKRAMLACLAFAFGATLQAKLELVSVDGSLILEKSKAGKEFAEKMRKEKEALEGFALSSQKELAQLQEEINLKAPVLSKTALQEKAEQFAQKRREVERKIADKEETARMSIQKEHAKLREEQMSVIKKMCERENWGALFEKSSALFVSSTLDKTAEVLKELDAAYDAKNTKSIASAPKKAAVAKKEIKVT